MFFLKILFEGLMEEREEYLNLNGIEFFVIFSCSNVCFFFFIQDSITITKLSIKSMKFFSERNENVLLVLLSGWFLVEVVRCLMYTVDEHEFQLPVHVVLIATNECRGRWWGYSFEWLFTRICAFRSSSSSCNRLIFSCH